MNKTETVNLIKGTFEPEDAKELLLQLLNSKIDFHNRRNWSSQERFGKPDLVSKQKLEYLAEARKNIQTFLTEAINQKKSVIINSSIELKIEE